MDVEFVYKVPRGMKITGMDGKSSKISEVNGWFDYPTMKAFINVGGGFYSYSSDDDIIYYISRTIEHEALHYAIYSCTKKMAGDGEERIVYKITGV